MVVEPAAAQAVERIYRESYGRILATLIRVFGDFDLAEDALQGALIAAVHAQAASPEATDWREIADLYEALQRVHDTPVVRLNRAAAVAMAEGPEAGLVLMERLDLAELDGFHPYHAARADLLRRAGRRDEAAAAYRRAVALCANAVERRYLEGRLTQLRGAGSQ